MTRTEIFAKLNEIFQDVFDDDTITVNDSTTATDIEDWDSLEQIHLVVAIEKAFKIKFNMNDVISLKNVGDMADIIERKLA